MNSGHCSLRRNNKACKERWDTLAMRGYAGGFVCMEKQSIEHFVFFLQRTKTAVKKIIEFKE